MVTGSFLIAGTALAAPPANDDFANAIVLSGNSGVQSGTNNIDATFQTGEGLMTGSVKTVWFKWTCPVGGGKFTVDTFGSKDSSLTNEWDAVLAVSSGSALNTQTRIGGTYLDRVNSTNPTTNSPADNAPDENISIAAVGGTTYYIQLAGGSNSGLDPEIDSSNIKLTWTFLPTVYEAKIIDFGPGAVVGAVSGNAATIKQILPYGADLATYAPTFTMSPSAICNQTSGNVPTPNFGSGPVVYSVTAFGASPTVNNYTVTTTADGYVWNIPGGGDWETSSANWQKQPGGLVTTYSPGSSAIFNNPAGGSINIPLEVTPITTLVSAPSGTYTFTGGRLGGTGSLTKSDAGILKLTGENTRTGSTVVNGGTLEATGTGALGFSSSYTVATGSTLTLNGTVAAKKTWPQNLVSPAGPNVATLTGGGTVNVDLGNALDVGLNFNMSAFTGNLNLTNGAACSYNFYSPGFVPPTTGTINIGTGATLYLGWDLNPYTANIRLNSGAGNYENLGMLRGDSSVISGTIVLNTNATIGCNGTLFTINSVISDGSASYGFTAVSGGTVLLTATNNTYTGTTTVSATSKLQCNTPGALGSGPLVINGKFDPNYTGTRNVASLTLGGVAKTAPGTYGSVASGATFQDDTFFKPGSLGTATVSGAVVSNYDTWLAGFTFPSGADKTSTGDPDGDGMTNQKEYAFGLNPTLGTSVNPITQMLDKTTGNFQYTRRATPVTTGLTYTVFTSTDLVTWTAGGSTQTGVATAGTVETVTVNVTAPAVNGKLFVRVEAKPAP